MELIHDTQDHRLAFCSGRFCGACGAKLATVAPVRSNTPWRKLVDVGLAISGVLVVLLVISVWLSEPDSRAVGNTAATPSSGSRDVVILESTYCYKDMDSLLTAARGARDGNLATALGIIARGDALAIAAGDRALHYTTANGFPRIRLVTGFHAGQRCYVVASALGGKP